MLMRRGQKSLNGFIFGTFVGHFPSQGTASMAVKGLTVILFKQICCNCLVITSVELSCIHTKFGDLDQFSMSQESNKENESCAVPVVNVS